MKRYDIEGVGVVGEDNASLLTFCSELDKVQALKVGEVAEGVHFHSGAGSSWLRVERVPDEPSSGEAAQRVRDLCDPAWSLDDLEKRRSCEVCGKTKPHTIRRINRAGKPVLCDDCNGDERL